MRNKRLIPLLFVGAFALTSCTLFDDSDLALHNHFNVPDDSHVEPDPEATYIDGVEGKIVEDAPNSLCFKNLCYAENETIENTYAVGKINHSTYDVNNNEDYYGNQSSNNYDLYVPNSASKTDEHIVVLFIHGGAWVSGVKTQVNPYLYDFANRGLITATLKYTLLKRDILKDDAEDDGRTNTELSIFRNLDEIDACIKSIKKSLASLGFDTTKTKLVIGGGSSGAHLSMLYSYSRGNQSELPIQFIIDAVGPVDIKPYCWQEFINPREDVLDAGLTKSAIEAQYYDGNLRTLPVSGEDFGWNEYHTMRIANGMCGRPFTLTQVKETSSDGGQSITNPNEAYTSLTQAGGGENQLSVTYWMQHSGLSFPIICAYAGLDGIAGINQFAVLQNTLDNLNIQYGYTYFRHSKHSEITAQVDQINYDRFVGQIDTWCHNVLAGEPLADLPHN